MQTKILPNIVSEFRASVYIKTSLCIFEPFQQEIQSIVPQEWNARDHVVLSRRASDPTHEASTPQETSFRKGDLILKFL